MLNFKMETPKSTSLKPIRTYTPHLSERKKQLFINDIKHKESDDILDGVIALNSHSNEKILRTSLQFNLTETNISTNTSTEDDDNQYNSRESSEKENLQKTTVNESDDDNLKDMFNNSMHICMSSDSSKEDSAKIKTRADRKRRASSTSSNGSPQHKISKMHRISISPRSFYSSGSTHKNNDKNRTYLPYQYTSPSSRPPSTPHSGHSQRRSGSQRINKGVYHKIRKPKIKGKYTGLRQSTIWDIDEILSKIKNKKLRDLISSKRAEREQIEKIHKIFRTNNNPIEMARPLSVLYGSDDKTNNNNDNNDAIETIDFSDIESSDEDFPNMHNKLDITKARISNIIINNNNNDKRNNNESPLKSVNQNNTTPVARKFFKSGRTLNTPKEIHINDHIKVIVCNRKISLVPKVTRTSKRILRNAFSDLQDTVDQILTGLEDSSNSNDEAMVDNTDSNQLERVQPEHQPEQGDVNNQEEQQEHLAVEIQNQEQQLEKSDAEIRRENKIHQRLINENLIIQTDIQNKLKEKYSKRLPYHTTDSNKTEQQYLLLDFLISNDILNENTFKIFITEPDNHKIEATNIVKNVAKIMENDDKYRSRVPFGTNDLHLMGLQQNFVEFLIDNNIANETNFDIFVTHYETRYKEALDIILEANKNLVTCVTANDENMKYKIVIQPFNEEENPTKNESIKVTQTESKMEDTNMEVETIQEKCTSDLETCSITNDVNVNCNRISNQMNEEQCSTKNLNSENKKITENELNVNDTSMEVETTTDCDVDNSSKLFPIFYKGQCQARIQPNSPRAKHQQILLNVGNNKNQMQIDAGQKKFGAQQCNVCGLVYSAHESEEEKLHNEYHNSLNILKFYGWIDENVVARYLEWGSHGRIIKLTETCPIKRKDRLMSILDVVDKELGFASYTIPTIFTAFLAVRANKVVGLCVVQPLQKAHKYTKINGVDCCTAEEFDAKCGISRIWVTPFQRRLRVASKIMEAVQLHTIPGEMISLTKIAFSAPTENGINFAKYITGLENFLVYQ